MPMQEFLASFAVQVDEDGARRLQAILDQNRDSAKDLAASFAAADAALTALKKNLSDAAGLKNILSALNSGISGAGGFSGSNSSSGGRGAASSSLSGSSLSGIILFRRFSFLFPVHISSPHLFCLYISIHFNTCPLRSSILISD